MHNFTIPFISPKLSYLLYVIIHSIFLPILHQYVNNRTVFLDLLLIFYWYKTNGTQPTSHIVSMFACLFHYSVIQNSSTHSHLPLLHKLSVAEIFGALAPSCFTHQCLEVFQAENFVLTYSIIFGKLSLLIIDFSLLTFHFFPLYEKKSPRQSQSSPNLRSTSITHFSPKISIQLYFPPRPLK